LAYMMNDLMMCVDDHDVFAFLTHSLTPATDTVSNAVHYYLNV